MQSILHLSKPIRAKFEAFVTLGILCLFAVACQSTRIIEEPPEENEQAVEGQSSRGLSPLQESVDGAYDTMLKLTKESSGAKLDRPVYYENYEFDEVVDRVLTPLGLRWTFHDSIDAWVDVSGAIYPVPARTLSDACRAAGLTWHAGNGTVYFDSADGESNDNPITGIYTVTGDGGEYAPVAPNAYAAVWRIGGRSWPGMSSTLKLTVVNSKEIQVEGYASDHAYFLERIPWAALSKDR